MGESRDGVPVVLGAGPVARAIVAKLALSGHRTRVLTRAGTRIGGAEAVSVDLTDHHAAMDAFAGASAVFHCAQPAYHRWSQDFPSLQESILSAAGQIGAVVVAIENMYGYGSVDGPMTETTPLNPCSIKGKVRAHLSTKLAEAHNAGRTRTVAVRSSDFFGPHVLTSAYGERFFGNLAKGRRPEVLGSLSALHSVTYIADVAAAMIAVAGNPESWGQVWHAPTVAARAQADFAAIAAKHSDAQVQAKVVPAWQLHIAGLFNKGAKETIEMLYEFDTDFIVDSTYTEQFLGLQATPLEEAVAQTVDWFARR